MNYPYNPSQKLVLLLQLCNFYLLLSIVCLNRKRTINKIKLLWKTLTKPISSGCDNQLSEQKWHLTHRVSRSPMLHRNLITARETKLVGFIIFSFKSLQLRILLSTCYNVILKLKFLPYPLLPKPICSNLFAYLTPPSNHCLSLDPEGGGKGLLTHAYWVLLKQTKHPNGQAMPPKQNAATIPILCYRFESRNLHLGVA